MNQPELPITLQRLWGHPSASKRGPRPGLTVERIVDTAVQMADADGLDAVSMAKVAKQLDVTTMALYRHVDSKDQLVELMVHAASGRPPALPTDRGWRTAIEAWAHAQTAMLSARPWMLDAPITGIPSGPNQVAWVDAGLTALRPTGLSLATRMGIVGSLSSFLRQDMVMVRELERSKGDRAWPEVEREFADSLAALIDPSAHPEMYALVTSDIFGTGSPDEDLTFALGLFLDGVEALAARSQD